MLQTWQHTGNHGKDVCIKLLYIIYIQSEIVEVFLPLVLLTQYVLSEEDISPKERMFGYFSQMDLPYLSVGLFTRVSSGKINGIATNAFPWVGARAICSRIRGRDGCRITGSSWSPPPPPPQPPPQLPLFMFSVLVTATDRSRGSGNCCMTLVPILFLRQNLAFNFIDLVLRI